MQREQLISKLRQDIIECLNLNGVNPDDISESAPLFGDDGIGLDSVDALEIVIMLEKKYSVSVGENSDHKAIMSSLGAIADFVYKNPE